MTCPTRSWPTTWAACCLAALLVAAPADAQDTLPEPADLQPEILQPGDTVPGVRFAFTRDQLEALVARLRNDSIRLAELRRDTANLVAQRDSVRSALSACGMKIDALQTANRAQRDAVDALEDAQPGALERLFGGPNGFAIGVGAGLVGGAVACGAGG